MDGLAHHQRDSKKPSKMGHTATRTHLVQIVDRRELPRLLLTRIAAALGTVTGAVYARLVAKVHVHLVHDEVRRRRVGRQRQAQPAREPRLGRRGRAKEELPALAQDQHPAHQPPDAEPGLVPGSSGGEMGAGGLS
jgi:hypothetical protein